MTHVALNIAIVIILRTTTRTEFDGDRERDSSSFRRRCAVEGEDEEVVDFHVRKIAV